MAKKKKTMEELLEEALVPEEEQPYEVPGNWVWTNIKTINTTKKRSIKPNEFDNEVFELYSVPSYPQGNPELVKGEEIGSNKQIVSNGDVLLCKINPRINRVWMVNSGEEQYRKIASTEWIVIKNANVHSDYLLMYFKSPYFRKLLTSNVTGVGGSLTRARPKEIENYTLPLPPLNEQKRIADKVERLLNKIDEAKRLIEEAKESFELRRAAILDKAFRGELTREWRELRELPQVESKQDGPYKLPQGWIWKKIGDLFHVQIGSTPSRKNDEYWGGAFSWLSSGEIQFNIINDSREYVTEKAINECRLKLAPKGSILFGMIGEGKTRGQVAILDIDSYHNQNTASIWVSETEIDSEYVYYWLLSQYTKNRQNSAGNNQPAYNKSRVKELFIPLPPLAEIKVMIHIIKGLMQKEIKVNELLELNITMDSIKQSILSKAFKGQLGTNDPTEENAIELLKEVLQEKL
ncbi:restriction endonuclease subunit S [Shouchella clausii]|uniref:Type I restriction modification DNA specificity domain-containing protein n=1 Tax=Shouchella clausii TaxID=79880 RepID=A0A268S305_SHOCL|nr:restriction endonuclease subunit S [Shouchella clausii]PAD41900.1 hypothetical protein CHH54_14855 [Bacillus sp. 7520-S]AST97083.1 hypothetical protein BC8716_14430 [Shouchella clausii]MCR1286584.1 restriction endonuclease subunit S [Shouchella clausii]MEB5473893.1 restriction endonuclease subunit S [Shouchella clausii]PAF26870.1 hypothetical protein CHH61_06295 [Shouchella clausii]